jgi:nitrogen fixation NifU-like protein
MDLRELYEEVILDHNRKPRNYQRKPVPCSHSAEGYNPLCGDEVTIHLLVEDGVVKDATFEGDGCAISTASASLLTEAVKGRTETEVQAIFERVRDLVTDTDAEPDLDALGKLAVLAGVREFPMRVKCATLPWHTLQAALTRADEPVTTE